MEHGGEGRMPALEYSGAVFGELMACEPNSGAKVKRALADIPVSLPSPKFVNGKVLVRVFCWAIPKS